MATVLFFIIYFFYGISSVNYTVKAFYNFSVGVARARQALLYYKDFFKFDFFTR